MRGMTTTGPELRAERKRINTERAERGLRDITVTAIGLKIGISRASVHAIENAAFPDGERVAQYRAALAELNDGTVAA